MQANVDICTRDLDIKVVRGSYIVSNLNISEDMAISSVKYLYTDINDVRRHYFNLGFHLREFDRCKYYFCFGYSCTADFAAANLGMDASAVSRCIFVFERFCVRSGYVFTNQMQDRYKDFSYSQLVEMATIKDSGLLSLIKPSMTVREIRDFKKNKRNDPSVDNVSHDDVDVSQIATSQKKYFNYDCSVKLKGAALASYMKSLDKMESVVLYVYDRSGNPIFEFNNVWVDVLEIVDTFDNPRIVLRL